MSAAPTPRTYAYYRSALQGQRLPLAFVDLDLLDANAAALSRRAAGRPMRVATKSVRCTWILRYILDHYPAFRGLMAYSPAEASFLTKQGFTDILLGYPTMEASEILPCLDQIRQGHWIAFMVDHPRQVELLAMLSAKLGVQRVPVAVDLDLSMDLPGLRFGVFRSPLQSISQAEGVLAALQKAPQLELQGVLGYEAQLAGIADAVPRALASNALIRLLKAWSMRRAFARRQAFTAELSARGYQLRFVNGGGTGSIESTAQDPSVTELTVGSGLYAPALFDHYRSFHHEPAMAFALPVVRQATAQVYACSGGGYIASGPTQADKQPLPYLPPGVKLIKTLGGGEVQTSLRSPVAFSLGDPVFLRHAKAGELAERFSQLHLIRQGRVTATVNTYRGDHACFF